MPAINQRVHEVAPDRAIAPAETAGDLRGGDAFEAIHDERPATVLGQLLETRAEDLQLIGRQDALLEENLIEHFLDRLQLRRVQAAAQFSAADTVDRQIEGDSEEVRVQESDGTRPTELEQPDVGLLSDLAGLLLVLQTGIQEAHKRLIVLTKRSATATARARRVSSGSLPAAGSGGRLMVV